MTIYPVRKPPVPVPPGGARSMEVAWSLAVLRLLWGSLLVFGHDERGYWAARHVLRADDPEDPIALGSLVAASLEAQP
jgi:hypothetical protein